MARICCDIMAALPEERRARIEARAQALVAEVEGLKALRQLAERSQEQIAASLGVKQPSVHKIERQAGLYLSTLRRFIKAAGGTLELRVEGGHAPHRHRRPSRLTPPFLSRLQRRAPHRGIADACHEARNWLIGYHEQILSVAPSSQSQGDQ